MTPAKHQTTLTAVCAACEWHGQRSLDKGEKLASAPCPRCGKKKLAEDER